MSRPRPMLVIALVLLPGLACGLHSPLSPLTLLLPACLLLWGTSVGCLVAHHRCADLALMATLFCVAALWSRSDQLLRERLSLDRLFETTTMCAEPLPVTLTGRIASEVVPFGEGRGIGFELDCRRAQLPDGSSLAVHAPVAIRLYGRARQRPLYREQWSLRGSLARAEPRWRTPCRLSGGVRGMQRHASRANYWALLCLRLRRRAAVVLAHDLEAYPGVTSIIHAMTLGYRKQLSPPIRELFSRVGAAHLFAVSGLHVAILVSMVVFLLGAVGIPRTRWLLFVLPLLVGYTFATGARPSAVRAGVMAVVFLSAPFLGRRSDGVATLALAAVLIALWDPRQLGNVGAIYSFTVVAGIMILYGPLMRRAAALWQRDPFDETKESWPSQLRRRACKLTLSLAVVALAAWLSSIPLTAHYFGRCSVVAVPCNLLVIPAAFLTLTSSMLSLLASGLCTGLADLFNNASAAIISMLVGVLRPVAAQPWACLELPRFPGWLVPLWYLALWGPALLWPAPRGEGGEGGEGEGRGG